MACAWVRMQPCADDFLLRALGRDKRRTQATAHQRPFGRAVKGVVASCPVHLHLHCKGAQASLYLGIAADVERGIGDGADGETSRFESSPRGRFGLEPLPSPRANGGRQRGLCGRRGGAKIAVGIPIL